jgi:hypothetical protein
VFTSALGLFVIGKVLYIRYRFAMTYDLADSVQRSNGEMQPHLINDGSSSVLFEFKNSKTNTYNLA